ncbi:hypothetical protein KVR01_013366 [Diaporthe batatas]|uniref:uncharacterized protein n=1 Tax=Diaporthe batatas TaxID=748121 RepID=UPI001D04137B|nr:uncharacterized protein KVR01_013366 [Diaporthe batatas]KAG8156761.1 hypothetical protein KVR01_013366 [Diaporthe batatas]
MIEDEWRFWVMGGMLEPNGLEPGCWQVVDWDQRRTISVTFECDVEDEDLAIEYLKRHIDDLGTDVCSIEVSKGSGELVSVSSDPNDDQTLFPYYPPLQDSQLIDSVETIMRSELRELDRLGPNVDLVSYQNRKVVFKYYIILQHLHQRWNELNIFMRLSGHPNIVPFDKVVIEKLEGSQARIVGFTSLYIAGGTLDAIYENPQDSRIFKLKWLLQLMSFVDDLNYKYGIQHQDIAPRNLLVDEATDNIMLFDFNFSARIGDTEFGKGASFYEERDDVKGVIFTLYEIITRDESFRIVPHRDQHPSSVLDMTDWMKHPDVRLDEPVANYRAELDTWISRRKERGSLKSYTNAPAYIDWRDVPEPTRRLPYSCNTAETYPCWQITRPSAHLENFEVIEWQRPAQKLIKEGMWVFADGRVVDMSNQA